MGVEGANREGLEAQATAEARIKEYVRTQLAVLHDLSRDVVMVTKGRDRNAREYYQAKVSSIISRCCHGDVSVSVPCCTAPERING